MKLRRAIMDDALDVLAWRNDPESIAASKTTKAVDRAEHLQWFSKAIESRDRLLLIAEEEGRKVGMIRFDRLEDAWLVSINLAAGERGKGHGRSILTDGMARHRDEFGPSRFVAEIKEGNEKSLRLFGGLGFVRRHQCDGFELLTRD